MLGSQKITLWGHQRTPLGILRVNRFIPDLLKERKIFLFKLHCRYSNDVMTKCGFFFWSCTSLIMRRTYNWLGQNSALLRRHASNGEKQIIHFHFMNSSWSLQNVVVETTIISCQKFCSSPFRVCVCVCVLELPPLSLNMKHERNVSKRNCFLLRVTMEKS